MYTEGRTFKSLMSEGIEEGETWVWKCVKIRGLNNGISINIVGYDIPYDAIFTLARKEFEFDEVINSFKDGIEIESAVTGIKYKLECKDGRYLSDGTKLFTISLEEIRGKWYINR